jgi:hypothetical protein
MTNYEKMKKKWQRRLKLGHAGDCFDPRQLAPGKFCVHLVDCGGFSMASVSEIEITGYFDSNIDLLGYLRFAEIPRILDLDSGSNRTPFLAVADAYLEKYETDQRNQIDRLLGLIDKALIAGAVSAQELDNVLDEFNATFLSTNPEIQILAWGNVAETLASPYFAESDEDQALPAELKTLLASHIFNEGNPAHLSMARDYLESRLSA